MLLNEGKDIKDNIDDKISIKNELIGLNENSEKFDNLDLIIRNNILKNSNKKKSKRFTKINNTINQKKLKSLKEDKNNEIKNEKDAEKKEIKRPLTSKINDKLVKNNNFFQGKKNI